MPPKIKIFEALGALADKRMMKENGEIHRYSSSGNKHYLVRYDETKNAIMTNDNGSYWRGYLGYPAIAYLMKIEKLDFNQEVAEALRGFAWKDINRKNKNDFDKTLGIAREQIIKDGIKAAELEKYTDNTYWNKLRV